MLQMNHAMHSYSVVLAMKLNIRKKEHHLGAWCIIAQLICLLLVIYKPINIWNAIDEIDFVHDWSNPASNINEEVFRLYACHDQDKYGYINKISFSKVHYTHTCYSASSKK